jgi:hypothetical protein
MEIKVVYDWKFDPEECCFELGPIEIKPEVQELMENGLDVKHYLSRHLRGNCGYVSREDNEFYTEVAKRVSRGEQDEFWSCPHSEYVIAPNKLLWIMTYAHPSWGPLSTIIGVEVIDPRKWNLMNVEEFCITALALLNNLPPAEREEIIDSVRRKIPETNLGVDFKSSQ